MESSFVKLCKNRYDDGIALAAGVMRCGDIVAFPTDTVFALGCDPFNPDAVRKLYEAKKRPMDKPVPILISDVSSLEKIAVNIPEEALKAARKYWPGALTIVFRKTSLVPDILTSGKDSVAVRIPDHPIAIKLIEDVGGFVAATSANLSGHDSTVEGDEVVNQLNTLVPLIINGEPLGKGTPSTIVDFSKGRMEIVRKGAISLE